MRNLLSRRPSPALVISMIALFVAMGGTGYAISKNSVGTKQLKNNAVTTAKIKKNAVTTTKIKKDAVNGERILESSLGKVPDADRVDGLDASAFERSGKVTRVAVATLVNGESRELYSQGPLRLTAKCEINNAGNDNAYIVVSTTQSHSAFDGEMSAGDFGPATPEGQRYLVAASTTTGNALIDRASDSAAVAPDGTQFSTGLWAGVNTLGQTARCQFGGPIWQS